jgi:hypothetical protein
MSQSITAAVPSAYQDSSDDSERPERSPLEPLGAFTARLRKWEKDNAWRAGQIHALESVGKKGTPTLPNIEPGK